MPDADGNFHGAYFPRLPLVDCCTITGENCGCLVGGTDHMACGAELIEYLEALNLPKEDEADAA